MADLLDNLKCLDLDGIRPVFDELAGHEADAGRQWIGDEQVRQAIRQGRHAGRPPVTERRRPYRATAGSGRSPPPDHGQTLFPFFRHTGQLCGLQPLRRSPTAVWRRWASRRQTWRTCCSSSTARQIEKVDFLYSVYFKSNEKESCQRLTHELTRRGHRVVAMLTHAKILLSKSTDGRSYVVESSANLRSCASIEQIAMTNRGLVRFHRTWLDEIMGAKK